MARYTSANADQNFQRRGTRGSASSRLKRIAQ